MPDFCRRRVRFELDADQQPTCRIHEVLSRKDMETNELEALFYNKDDYKLSRSLARSASLDVDQRGEGWPLQTAFGLKSKESQEQLITWATADHGCRGLERWSSKVHGEKRQVEQFTTVMAVLEAQHEMMMRGNEIDPEALRKTATKASRNARHFARMIGKADSHAVALQLLSDQALNDAFATIWDYSNLRLMSETTTDEEKSIADSIHVPSVITSTTRITSLLVTNSDENDEDLEEVDLMPTVEDMHEAETTGVTSTRKNKTKKLRLLKKIRRRMSTSYLSTQKAAKGQ